MSDPAQEIEAGLARLGDRFKEAFARADSEPALRNAKAEMLGKKGELTAILRQMGKVAAEQRKAIGEQVNAVKQTVEAAFDARLAELKKAAAPGGPGSAALRSRRCPAASRSNAATCIRSPA